MISILLICDTLAFKIVDIFGFEFIASGLIFPASFLLACVVAEVYGYDLAGRIIWVQALCQLFFILMVNLLIFSPSPPESQASVAYFYLYHYFWRVGLIGSFAVPIAYFCNDFIISKIKIFYNGHLFFLRYLLSNAVGKASLVFLSYPVTFYKIYPFEKILHFAYNTWLAKIAIGIVLFPIATGLAQIIKRIEKLDYYDYGISYNPLKVFKSDSGGKNEYNREK